MRVHITDLRSGDRITEDIFNTFGLHVLSSGATLNEKEISRLYQHRIDFVEIEGRHALLPEEEEDAKPPRPPTDNPLLKPHYQDAVAGAEQLFERAMAEGKIYEEDVERSFQPLVDNIKAERDVVSLLLMLNSQDDYTYQHSVQVGMLSYYIARWIGWSEAETVLAGKAGFLHDIGKCQIPEAILAKPDRLTDEEYEQIKNHTRYGYEILSNSFDDSQIALAALQHHERMDGSGYPQGLTMDDIHPLARVVAVADVYSAMISSRVYREKRDLLVVLKEMYELSFSELDPYITHTFIRRMLPNFIGKKVELTSGDTGTIVMTNPTDFFRPLVRIGETFLDLSKNRNHEIKQVFM